MFSGLQGGGARLGGLSRGRSNVRCSGGSRSRSKVRCSQGSRGVGGGEEEG
jgi:hypothetical protein